MIDVLTEQVLSLGDAAKTLPARRGGKRPHVSCLYRWTVNGCRGVILESVAIGGTRCTSREALARFFDQLSFADGLSPLAQQRTEKQRQRAVDAAARDLEERGW
jgi:hypothetical protein